MRLGVLLALMSGVSICAHAADVCNPADLQGAYGFQLNGETTISGSAKPAESLGRLVFDGEGAVSGASSVKFAGLLLGNPVTGTYEAHTDCSVTWSLQDDSGAYQHFSGTASPDGLRVRFRQTDPGGMRQGLLLRTAAQECKLTDFQSKYAFTIAGTFVPMTEAGGQAGAVSKIAVKGAMAEDSNHHFQLKVEDKTPYIADVAISIEPDCGVDMSFALAPPEGGAPAAIALRGILVDKGKQILAIQTDPGAMVSAHFTAP